MKIGIFGGTFDPPHNTHLAIAQSAKDQLGLDDIIMIPAARNPLKTLQSAASSKQRLEMTRLAVEGLPGFSVSDIEISRGGRSYTVDSLQELTFALPGDYWVIMGADSLRNFHEWKAPEKILKMARLAVALRPPQSRELIEAVLTPETRARIDWLEIPPTDLSSTDIRGNIARKRTVSLWVPEKVLQYIEKHKLYKT